MSRTKQWSDDVWPKAQLIFPGQDCGPIVACLKSLAKRHDQSTVIAALDKLEGRRFEAGKMWAVLQFECAQIVKERARSFGSVGRGSAPVDRF